MLDWSGLRFVLNYILNSYLPLTTLLTVSSFALNSTKLIFFTDFEQYKVLLLIIIVMLLIFPNSVGESDVILFGQVGR